jgi:hypothetical protein
MPLLLICPHCQDKAPIPAKTCGQCGANLQDLPPESRRYFVGRPEAAATTPAALELSPEPIPDVVEVELLESHQEAMGSKNSLMENKDVSLCEALDRILHKGAVLFGEVMISVADIDLVYLGLQVILASMETARGLRPLGEGQLGPNLFDKGDR